MICDIAHRIIFECIRIIGINDEAQYVHVSYGDSHERFVDIERFYWIDRGIDEALVDLWLTDLAQSSPSCHT